MRSQSLSLLALQQSREAGGRQPLQGKGTRPRQAVGPQAVHVPPGGPGQEVGVAAAQKVRLPPDGGPPKVGLAARGPGQEGAAPPGGGRRRRQGQGAAAAAGKEGQVGVRPVWAEQDEQRWGRPDRKHWGRPQAGRAGREGEAIVG